MRINEILWLCCLTFAALAPQARAEDGKMMVERLATDASARPEFVASPAAFVPAEVPAAGPGIAVELVSARASRPSATWSDLLAKAEKKKDGKLKIEIPSSMGGTTHTLSVRREESGKLSVTLEDESLLSFGGSFIGTTQTFETDDQGETLSGGTIVIYGESHGDSAHDPLANSLDPKSEKAQKAFQEEKTYWLKNWRRAR